ncbi:MAG: hypothetical protein KDA21_06930 [Phycisphaerales bacterium]|nr:hypothetical protein [Phycisphaerales bacterium]
MTRRRTGLILGLALATLSACSSSGRPVTFTVSHARDGAPVEAARVRAAPLGVSPAPLPVSLERIEEADAARGDAGFTDARGEVTLHLEGYRYLIDVFGSPFAPGAEHGQWVWDARTGGLEAGETPSELRLSAQPRD